MSTLTKRKRARLALQLLGKQPEPRVGDHVLIWARFDGDENGRMVATVTATINSRAFREQPIFVDREDIALVTTERPT